MCLRRGRLRSSRGLVVEMASAKRNTAGPTKNGILSICRKLQSIVHWIWRRKKNCWVHLQRKDKHQRWESNENTTFLFDPIVSITFCSECVVLNTVVDIGSATAQYYAKDCCKKMLILAQNWQWKQVFLGGLPISLKCLEAASKESRPLTSISLIYEVICKSRRRSI